MPLKTHDDEAPTLNLTSMIDILFLLIIFFMTGTQFTELERKIGLKVPQVADGKHLPPAPDRVTVGVYSDGRVTLERELVTVDQLRRRLAQLQQSNPQLVVMVRGDEQVALKNVASVLAACRQAGVTDLGITVRLAQREQGTRR